MEARAKLLGHSLHQQLVPIPVGLLIATVAFDLLHLVTEGAHWAGVAYWVLAAGLIGALLAAPFGLVDWLAIPGGTRAKRVGAVHGVGNLVVVALFGSSWLLRGGAETAPAALALVLSFAGGALALGTAWLGGELVDRLGVGVADGAHLDAPSSLSGLPADGRSRR